MTNLTNEQMVLVAALVIISYFVGSLSPATMMGKLHGIDIRKEGSGNPGTTNVLRTLGKKAAACTLVIDVLKGFLPVLAAKYIIGLNAVTLLCGTAALLGHMYPLRFGFKGGKGVATGFGFTLALDWHVGIIALIIAVLGVLLSKRMSVGSIVAALSFPVTTWIFLTGGLSYEVVWALALALLIIWRHRANVGRLLRGEEPPLGFFNKNK